MGDAITVINGDPDPDSPPSGEAELEAEAEREEGGAPSPAGGEKPPSDPPAGEKPTEERTVPLREHVRIRQINRELKAQLDAAQAAAADKPPEERAQELAERFADDPGAALLEVRSGAKSEVRAAVEALSFEQARAVYGEDEFNARVQFLDSHLRAHPELLAEKEELAEKSPHPWLAMCQLAEKYYLDQPETLDASIEAEVERRVRERVKGQLVVAGVSPAGAGGPPSGGPAHRPILLADASFDQLIGRSMAELEAEAERE